MSAYDMPIPEGCLDESQMRWMWSRYQTCRFPCASYPKRFAGNAFASLTREKGWPQAVRLSYQYRRQIFHQGAAKWTLDAFLNAVRQEAAKVSR